MAAPRWFVPIQTPSAGLGLPTWTSTAWRLLVSRELESAVTGSRVRSYSQGCGKNAPVEQGGNRVTAREERLVLNETLFRQVNERLRELGESFSVVAEQADFICECSDERCAEQIQLTLEQYERVRSDPIHFVVIRGHEIPAIERVAYEVGDRLLVVEKLEGQGAETAVAADERTDT
jgi:hypothetical protein